jgi:hypothetical protein
MMKMISTKIKVTSIFIFEWISVVGLATYEYCCRKVIYPKGHLHII